MQDDWSEFLPLAEFALNNSVIGSTRLTPFFTVYGNHPRSDYVIEPIAMSTSVPASAEFLQRIKDIHQLVGNEISHAQESYKA